MVYSFQDSHFVTWEHTRIMLMFLRCLQFSYTGGLIQKVGGCWQDVRQKSDASQPNGLRRHEGLGFKLTMERHVRDVRIDFIRVNKAYQWMLEFSAIPMCLELLENYLRQLCLCAFRKDVFFYAKSALKPEYLESALSGEIPLCYDSKPCRMLFQQSFHAIKTLRGKAGAHKGEIQFIWWPSAHQGLIRHYAKCRQTGTLAYLLPACNIKLYPIDSWQLIATLFSKSYMPNVI
ncbi:hypothetical protein BKA60DRAFT_662516 [Fusarium oxysporum]|nr:hypothetical protein BKA60DRAFT_662516 [Fusarium oxysporum]